MNGASGGSTKKGMNTFGVYRKERTSVDRKKKKVSVGAHTNKRGLPEKKTKMELPMSIKLGADQERVRAI